LVDFHHYNKAHGWEGGNELISEFADYLAMRLPEYLIFRIWGDRFVLADFEGDIEALISESSLFSRGVGTKTKEIVNIPDNLEELMTE
jgi:GGDEF domain-containing protein